MFGNQVVHVAQGPKAQGPRPRAQGPGQGPRAQAQEPRARAQGPRVRAHVGRTDGGWMGGRTGALFQENAKSKKTRSEFLYKKTCLAAPHHFSKALL